MTASLGIAGVNTRPLMAALGIAGNWGSNIRPHLKTLLASKDHAASNAVGDRAVRLGWDRACLFLDYTYVTCPAGKEGMRYAAGFEEMCAPQSRALPVYLDSAAFRESTGQTQKWAGYDRYCQAIDLIRPTAAMAKDVIGNQEASHAGYERMREDGYRDVVLPVWQIGPSWAPGYSAVHNARFAARDPILRAYASSSPLVGIGGLVFGPCPVSDRAAYFGELCKAFPGVQFWALGQASATVINGLGARGLLDRVWSDGTWWIHHTRSGRLAVLEDGFIGSVSLTGTGKQWFLPRPYIMTSNLSAPLGAYAGAWDFPGPAKVPTNLDDPDEAAELFERLRQANFFGELEDES